jgi:F0F1-type ATP synthase assembly protein I
MNSRRLAEQMFFKHPYCVNPFCCVSGHRKRQSISKSIFNLKQKKMKRSIFLFVGLMISSVSQIASHFIKMPDFISGSFMGIGIGVMLLSFISHKPKAAH